MSKRGASAVFCIASRSCVSGDAQVVVTPVRRSARKPVASQALPSSVLRQSGYSYMPNSYLESRLGKEVVIGPPEAFRAFLEVRGVIACPILTCVHWSMSADPTKCRQRSR